jgi:SAM-dependent methyltransferase
MKYRLLNLIRSLGVLRYADAVKYGLQRLRVGARNRRFVRANPGFAVPPYDLAFDAYNHFDWHAYHDSGRRHAEIFARIIRQHGAGPGLRILEWGCGPGRLIRHLPGLLEGRAAQVVGSDYNPRSIAWCREHLAGIGFVHNEILPPLPFAEAEFDAVYCFSVFTHLSEEAQRAWASELGRVLKPGGLLICTTHGDNYQYLLTSKDDRRRYDAGEVIIQGRYAEGKKWYFAIHPARFVREGLLKQFTGVERVAAEEDDQLLQDVWIAYKPEVVAVGALARSLEGGTRAGD